MASRLWQLLHIPDRYTLRFTLGSAFAGIALIVSLLTGLVMYFAVSRYSRAEFGNRLGEATRVAVLQVDWDAHRRLREPADEGTETYARLKRQLQEIRGQVPDVRYIYTTRLREDGRVVFVVDAEEDPDLVSDLGEVYEDYSPALWEALTAPRGTRRSFVASDFYTDRWGTWLSAYVPHYAPDGSPDGVLGMDISAAKVLAYERGNQLRVLLLSLLGVAVVAPFGVVVGRRLCTPFARLEAEMAKVRDFELDGPVAIESRVAEVDQMVHQFRAMKGGLRSFRKYVPADLVRRLIEQGVEAEPGGEHEEVSIFFSDIAGFTTVSEGLTPEQLVEHLGEYLSEVTAVLLEHGATVDKYIGDAVMAFWNAPGRQDDHAGRACRAALACQARIAALNRRWAEQGRTVAFHTRIGLNTGEVVVGNIGSEQRLSYTIIGDSVNLASRLEGTNKFYGTDILMAGSTYERVSDWAAGRRVDRVVVKGKTVPIDLYELLGTRDEVAPAQLERAERYARGFDLYVAQQFAAAAGVFEELLARDGDDPAAAQLLLRCRRLAAEPPQSGWDGSYAYKEK